MSEPEATNLCPLCQSVLTRGPNEEPFWCQSHYKSFAVDDIKGSATWRSMSWSERAIQVRLHGASVTERFHISEDQYFEAVRFVERQASQVLHSGDVAPDKQALLSLARGLNDEGALREFIDNALDCSQKKRSGAPISVSIELNAEKGFVRISDNAGGMTESELFRCMKLGSVSPDKHFDNVIGKFGVGAKEAIYHFGREVTISSCDLAAGQGLEMYVAAAFLDNKDWNVDLRAADVTPGTSSILITVLEHYDFDREQLRLELGATYSKRIKAGRLNILLDGSILEEDADAMLLYPPELYPRRYAFTVSNVLVDVNVAILEDEPTSAGIIFYAFGRLFAHWTWADPLTNTIVAKPPQHRLNSHIRVEIDFQGRIEDIPINSNKDQVVTNKPIFRPLAKMVSKIAQPYLSIISWLSKDNNMRRIQTYSGFERRHPSVTSNSPGLETKIELGKIYDGMTLSKPRAADPTVLFETMATAKRIADEIEAAEAAVAAAVAAAEAAAEAAEAAAKAEASAAADALAGAGAVVEAEALAAAEARAAAGTSGATGRQRREGVLVQRAPITPSVVTVSLLTEDIEKVHAFKRKLENVADEIGVAIQIA